MMRRLTTLKNKKREEYGHKEKSYKNKNNFYSKEDNNS